MNILIFALEVFQSFCIMSFIAVGVSLFIDYVKFAVAE